MGEDSYRLPNYDLTYHELATAIIFSKYALDHLEVASTCKTWGGYTYHMVMGTFHLIPIVSFVLTMLEKMVFEWINETSPLKVVNRYFEPLTQEAEKQVIDAINNNPSPPFFIHHTPKLLSENVTKTTSEGHVKCADFEEFFKQLLNAQKNSGATEVVWSSFDVQADIDKAILLTALTAQQLRYRIAEALARAFSRGEFSNMQLHLCQTLKTDADNGELAAYSHAFSTLPEQIKQRITIEKQAQGCRVAQALSDRLGPGKVSLAVTA